MDKQTTLEKMYDALETLRDCANDIGFDDDQMMQIYLGAENRLSREQFKIYATPEFDEKQMTQVLYALKGLKLTTEQVQRYALPTTFNADQMEAIFYGLADGLTAEQVDFYAKPEYDWYIMTQTRYALTRGVPMDFLRRYIDKDFMDFQFRLIIDSYIRGLSEEQIATFAKPEIKFNEMQKMATELIKKNQPKQEEKDER